MSASLEAERARWASVMDGAGLSRRVSLLYAAIYLHYGVYGVFMPLWFQHKGMTAAQIGTLLALPTMLRVVFVAPVTALADRLRRVREVLFACTAITAALVLALKGMHTYASLLVFFTLFAVAWDPLPVLADGYASAAVRARNLDFGRMRLWGTIALVSATMAGGTLLDKTGVELVPLITCLLLLVPLFVLPFLPPDRLFGESTRAAAGEWRSIVRDKPAMFVLLGVALIVGSNAMLLGFGAIQWAAKGISNGNIGIIFAVASVSEVLVFVFAQKLLGKRSELWMLVVGAAVTIIRWLGMATDPGLEWLAVIALMQGPAGTTVIAGTILYIARRFPTHLVATANGVNAVMVGVAASAVTFAAGYLWAAYKALAYIPMAGLSLVALIIFLIAARRERLAPNAAGAVPTPTVS